MIKETELNRQALWSEVVVAYIGASNSTNKNGAYSWADIALEEFDKRFTDEDK